MNLDEVLSGGALPYKVVRARDHTFIATFVSNDRKIQVDIEDMGGPFGWEIGFVEKQKNEHDDEIGNWSKTGGGKEIEVFATVKKIVHEFIRLYKPQRIRVASDANEPSRTKLYDRMAKRGDWFPGYKLETSTRGDLYDKWSFVKEGMMKRSNVFVSGEAEMPKRDVGRRDAPTPAKLSATDRMIANLAKRANVSTEEVKKARAEIIKDVDSKNPNRWNIIMARLNRHFGL